MTSTPTPDQIAAALEIDLVEEGVQFVNGRSLADITARAPFEGGLVPWSALRSALVVDLPDEGALKALHQLLGYVASPDRIGFVVLDRSNQLQTSTIEIEHLPSLGPLVAALIPAQDAFVNGSDPRALQQIVARLRDTDGCPWDRQQTMTSLRDTYVNEVFEVVDAIDAGDADNLAEELGDLFLIISMQSQIAREQGAFTIEDVFVRVTSKIIGRHPHVFGTAVVNSQADLAKVWNDAKAKEREVRPDLTPGKDLDGEPRSMPALTRASRVLERYPLHDPGHSQLLSAVADVLASGQDPEQVLRVALREHVQTTRRSADNASPAE